MAMQSGVWAVVVARVANGAKSRLSPALDLDGRQALGRSMLARVVDVCTTAPIIEGVAVVVDEAAARVACEARGAVSFDDPHPGDMNAAVRLGLQAAAE